MTRFRVIRLIKVREHRRRNKKKMDNPEKLAIFDTHDTGRRQTNGLSSVM